LFIGNCLPNLRDDFPVWAGTYYPKLDSRVRRKRVRYSGIQGYRLKNNSDLRMSS